MGSTDLTEAADELLRQHPQDTDQPFYTTQQWAGKQRRSRLYGVIDIDAFPDTRQRTCIDDWMQSAADLAHILLAADLPAHYLLVVKLRADGWSYNDIAATAGAKPCTCRQWHCRAMLRLQVAACHIRRSQDDG